MTRFTIGDESLTVTLVPETGARIAQLTDQFGTNWLVETGRPEPGWAPDIDPAAVDFTEGTQGGWDDCLPSVSPTDTIADHGDFWFRPWSIASRTELSATLGGPDFGQPVHLVKHVAVLPGRAAVDVTLEAFHAGDGAPVPVLYSAHPLFRWPSTAVLEFPGAEEIRHVFGAGKQPITDGVSLPSAARAETYKSFVRWAGRACMTFPDSRRRIVVSQPPGARELPWLGVCINRGCWPPADPGESWIALEPTTSPIDALDEAVADGTAVVLAPGESVTWAMTVTLEEAP